MEGTLTMSEATNGIEVGMAIPAFTLPTAEATTITQKDLSGNPYILYFYPKADTSGCTKQAQEFSNLIDEFSKLRIPIIAISADPVSALIKFRDKHRLKVLLASAEGSRTLNDFGVWVEKSMYGRKYMGIERSTFLVDSHGKVAKVWNKVKVPGHAADVLKSAQAM